MLGHALIVNQMYLLSSGKKTSTCLLSHLPRTLNTSARQCPPSGRLKTSSGTTAGRPPSRAAGPTAAHETTSPPESTPASAEPPFRADSSLLRGSIRPISPSLHPLTCCVRPTDSTPSIASPIHPPTDCFSSASPPSVHEHDDSKGTRRLLPLPVARDTTIGSPQARTHVVRSHQFAPVGHPSAAQTLASLPPSRASARSIGNSLPHVPASHGTASRIL